MMLMANTKFGRHISLGQEEELRQPTKAEVSLLFAKLVNVTTNVTCALRGTSMPKGSTIPSYPDILAAWKVTQQPWYGP